MAGLKLGNLARLGLVSGDAAKVSGELVKQIEADGIETVRFLFSDQHGILRGKAIVASAVGSVLENGLTVPSSLLLKDTSSRTVFPVWQDNAGFGPGIMTGAGDMLLAPDATTFRRLPWSPHSAWILCDLYHADGTSISFAPRNVLSKAVDRLAQKGMRLQIGLEVEFQVFRLADQLSDHEDGGMPGSPPLTKPLNQGYQLLGEVAYSSSEPLLDELRRNAVSLGLPVRSVEVEFGPGQFEFTFDPAAPEVHADNMVCFRTMVKEVCARNDLLATFMCKPLLPHCAASGWHVHQSLIDIKSGHNLFQPEDDQLTKQADGWIAGLLKGAEQSCVLANPTVNSYGRFRPGQLAPDRIQWARDNKGAMLRALMRPGDPASRVENRAPEPSANPHFLFASQIFSGLHGVEQEFSAPTPAIKPYENDAPGLPSSLIEAVEAFERGELYRSTLGPEFIYYISTLKRAEWERSCEGGDDWEQREYFQLF